MRATIDHNNDGVSDIWYWLHPNAGATLADPDGDGAINLAEALAGTDPLDASSRFHTTAAQPDSSGNLVLRWASVVGKSYQIESSPDLAVWTTRPGTFTGAGNELGAVVHPAGSPLETKQFWRIAVSDCDTDSDGLNDWEEALYGTSPTDPDSDGDGKTDGWEVNYGRDPRVADVAGDDPSTPPPPAAPFISAHPASTAVPAGKTATFSVTASGVPSPIYQWLRNGAPISGATSASYTTPTTTIADNGALFTVVITNSSSVTSNPATLTVTVRRLYYVSTSGHDTNDGTSPQTAWRTVTYAAMKAIAGDTVYIKAGLYNDELVWIGNSGTENAPIIFQGYQNTPGDTPDPHYTPGAALDSNVIPVLENLDQDLMTSGHGMGITTWAQGYFEIRNLGVTSFNYGIFPRNAHHVVIENVYAIDQKGHGIRLCDITNVTVRNCIVTDNSMCNILLERVQDGLVENCTSYAVSAEPDPLDYHIALADSQNVVVRDCRAYNLHWEHTDAHTGHGIGIKDTAGGSSYPYPHSRDNTIVNCAAYNMGEYYFVAHEAYNNVFEGCTAKGQFRAQAFWSEGINIRDGAHDNTFRNCRVEGIRTSVAFQDTTEGLHNPDTSDIIQISSRNALVNCRFMDSDIGIQLWNAEENLFRNCLFDGTGRTLFIDFRFSRTNPGNTIRNSIITNIEGGGQGDWGSGDRMLITYSDFWRNNFSQQGDVVPFGTGNLAQDPQFADAARGDYHLKSQQGRWDIVSSTWVKDTVTSPCIDSGDPADDFSAEPSPNGNRINIGVYGGTTEASKGSSN